MVSYDPLWKTMKERQITTYALIKEGGIDARIINNMKHNKGITIDTLEKICKALACTPNDVLLFVDDESIERK